MPPPAPLPRKLNAALLLAALWVVPAGEAAAEEAVTVEFFPGVVVSSNRLVAMGGAYTGIAAGADAHLINPASFAQRHAPRRARWFTGDWTLSWLNEAPSPSADSRQELAPGGSFHIDLGAHLNFGRFGVGFHAYEQSFAVSTSDEVSATRRTANVAASYGGLGLGWSAWRDQLTVGLLISSASLWITRTREDQTSYVESSRIASEGQGATLGLHLQREGRPWQVGLRARREMKGLMFREQTGGEEEGEVQPEERARLVIPAQLAVGGALEIDLERVSVYPLLLSADLVLTAKSQDATTLKAFALGRDRERTGEQTTLAPHLGSELEAIEDRLRLRAGGYWEPDRARDALGRPHGTLGAALRAKLWLDWRLDACLDVAPRGYLNWGFGVGLWTPHPSRSP